ncbi:metal ABC transporter ATP-binding protein [Lentibacillus cibarius]|uniref:Metal ABC transporter ATP-binding protein n=1 Tax=Lentibacillus cibarius TaxID=2583219 RepID=A0A549YMH5_9BACI|nr:metal ABC transporter ATP-binding protein [Lentibacillus cibarius]TRM13075.1 metal ABC transporter ATP-binding protein [Lentibacillus cibarius]
MAEPVVSITNLTYAYEQKTILTDIHFELPRGSFMGLIGPNGGGKTTLIKMIIGLLRPDSGTIRLFGQPIQQFKDWSKIGFVSQKANSFNKGFPATVFEVVSMGLTAKLGYFTFFKFKHKQKVLQAIDQVGMRDYAYKNIGQLSGGQQQRIFIARALVSDPELLILDEPTVGVDQENVQRFYELLRELNKKHAVTLLLVTHDTDDLLNYATGIVHLNKTLTFFEQPKK